MYVPKDLHTHTIPAVYFSDTATEHARRLAQKFDLPTLPCLPDNGEYLLADAEGVSLCRAGEKGRVRVDFGGGAAQYRRTKGGGELIAKAVNHTTKPTVWDGTGGLGRDSFVLASLGLSVHTFEQHPAVACLLADGLARALADAETAPAAEKPAEKPKPRRGGSWVQAGSFSSKENADKMIAQLKKRGWPVETEIANINGKDWHRVFIGPLSAADANTYIDILGKEGTNARQVNR